MRLNFRNMEKMAFVLLVLIVGLLTGSGFAVVAVTVVGLLVHWIEARKYREMEVEVSSRFIRFVAERHAQRAILPKMSEDQVIHLDLSETHVETPQKER